VTAVCSKFDHLDNSIQTCFNHDRSQLFVSNSTRNREQVGYLVTSTLNSVAYHIMTHEISINRCALPLTNLTLNIILFLTLTALLNSMQ